MNRRIWVAALALLMGAAALLTAPVASADAPAVPFVDKNVSGALGFCDKTGHEITSGPLDTAPFAWFAAASTAAPSGYGKGKATLYAFQPIKDVDPGNWSGRQLTGSSSFSNAKVPMASGTVLDPALGDFVAAFPPRLDSLVQLRMYFNAPDLTQYRNSYPAAVLKVTSTTWTLVQGGGVNCTAGTAVSNEVAALPASDFAKPARPTPAADAPKAARDPQQRTPSAFAPASSGSPTSGSPGATVAAKDAAHTSGGSGGSGGVIAAIVAAAVVVAGGAAWWLRRRRA